MKKMPKTNAQKYWLEFEKLSAALIEDQFSFKPTFLRLTPPSKDGGYDAEITFQLSSPDKLNLTTRIFSEAKLRGKSDVDLRTFAATLVVAHNQAGNALIIVTNRLYTPQAVAEVARFVQTTRMQIRLVDGPAVSIWVRSRYGKLKDLGYPVELLNWLSEETTNETRNFDVPLISAVNGLAKTKAHLSIGTDTDGRLTPCIVSLSDITEELPPIIGENRQILFRELVSCMTEKSGVALLEGPAGAGKSFLLAHAVTAIRSRKNVSQIDLSVTQTATHLFLTIFERLTGIELHSVVLGSNIDQTYVAKVLSVALGAVESEKFTQAISAVLLSSDDALHAQNDLNKAILAEYLGRIAKCQSELCDFLVICENLNKATSEILNFLLSIINSAALHGVFLIELRTDGEASRTSPSDWNTYQGLFRETATLNRLKLTELAESDALALIDYWLPALGEKRANIVLNRVGFSPFLIEVSCRWLMEKGIVGLVTENAVTIQNLEKFFDGINPSKATVVIQKLLDFWIGHSQSLYKDAIFSAALMDGDLPLIWLRDLDPSQDEASLADVLIKTGIFDRHRSLRSALRVRHDLLRECCANLLNDHTFAVEKMANRLRKRISEFFPEGRSLERIEVKLSLWVGDFETAFLKGTSSAKKFHVDGLLTDASAMWELAYQAAEACTIPEIERNSRIAMTLLNQLKVEHTRNRLQLDINKGRLAALETHISVSPFLSSDIEYQIDVGLLRWRRLFILEQFDEAYTLSQDLLHRHQNIGDSLQASILSAIALTEKGLGKREESKARYDSAVKKFPKILSLQKSRLSNIGASYLTTDPQLSLNAYLEIRKLFGQDYNNFSLRDTLHLNVDISMAHFLMGNYEVALVEAEEAAAAALSNAYETQEARARNIAACCHWARKDISAAFSQIEFAVFAAERSYYLRFLWRMRVNAAGIAADLRKWDLAHQHASEAFRLIAAPRQRQFANSGVRKERWYVGLLAALLAIDRNDEVGANRLAATTSLPCLREDLDMLRQRQWPPLVFGGTTHIHADRIMITG